ncbi:MAG TPA: tetratricopeptide repeat protein, partial [Bryobacteraceae bacterium]|nr:tetratricopeptide repeat protein [Bryobacteraceae bacterium]
MLIPSMIVILAFADSSSDSSAAADRARQAWARQQYAEAQAGFHTAAEDARAAANDSAALEYTRLEAAVQRDSGNAAAAEVLLAGTGGDFAKAHGENAPELAAIWEDMALLERFQGHPEAAAPLLEKAIAIREPHPDPALARDITAEAMLQGQLGHHDLVIDLLKHAVAVWDTASPGDPQSLAALDALAAAYRDQSRYDDAEPLLERSLCMREALFGPDSADLISAVDSLAYVQFGRGRLPEAEALYDRLLALWQKNAAPNHPMVALTL